MMKLVKTSTILAAQSFVRARLDIDMYWAGTPVAKPSASSSGAEDASISGDTDKEDAVEAVQYSSGRTAGACWLTHFVLSKQLPTRPLGWGWYD